MKKRTRNRLILVIGFLVALGIVVTIISLIIAAICGAFSGGGTAEVPDVEIVYDATSSQTASTASEDSSSADDSSAPEDGDDSSSEGDDTSSVNDDNGDDSKSPEDFVADNAENQE